MVDNQQRRPIRISLLKFDSRFPVEGPGGTLPSSAVKEELQENKRRIWLEYHPWLRAFKITIRNAGADSAPRSGFIPEHQVMYFETCDEE